jgi:hypothetical protein
MRGAANFLIVSAAVVSAAVMIEFSVIGFRPGSWYLGLLAVWPVIVILDRVPSAEARKRASRRPET